MSSITTVARNELTAPEIIDIVNDGGRVIIEQSILATSVRLVIRYQDGTYYCDTPMKLMKHETEEELRDCLERYRLTKPVSDEQIEVAHAAT